MKSNAKIARQKEPFLKRLWRWTKRTILLVLIFQLLYIVALKWIYPPVTITQFASWISGDGLKRDYVSGAEIPSSLKLAVIASEDQIFPDHSGFDWKNIKKAMEYNQKKPNRVRGASTISQQVAKNVFLWQGRGWLRKAFEVYFTKMIEWVWGKRRILDVYLNVIEMGKGIYGAEAAAQSNFGKHAKDLSRREAAMIAACLPNPKLFTIKPLHKQVAARSSWVMGQMSFLEKDEDVQKIVNSRTP